LFGYFFLVLYIVFYNINKNVGLKTSGIFRVNANLEQLRHLKEEINKGNDPLPPLDQNTLDVHIVAGLFKSYFRELSEPLCTFELYDCFLASATINQDDVRCDRIRNLLRYLPPSNYTLLRFLIEFLAQVAEVKISLVITKFLFSSPHCFSISITTKWRSHKLFDLTFHSIIPRI
jgi:hypothetical protein